MLANKEISATAITLKYYDIGESDKIYALFSREYGIIRAVAKGIKKPKSKFSGRLDLLNVNELVIREGRNLGTIVECESYKVFPLLRLDYDKLIYSLFLGELILLFSNEGESFEQVFDLLISTLEAIQKADIPLIYIIWFEIQFLSLLGYQSNFSECDICKQKVAEKNNRLGYSLSTGSIICEHCLKITYNYKIIDDSIKNILNNLKYIDINSLSEFNAEAKNLNKIQDVLKEYLSSLSERKIKTLSVFDN
ncbi:MAG: DNA repair protein RecO [Candidatus Sericytochromatia bacterium]|nr:DNA repair protein RecO [Candidatus Sericytochromatia bacterium]